MKDGDVAALLEALFDLKAAGCRNILEVHAAERPREQGHGFYDVIHVLGPDAKRDRVHIAEGLEKSTFSFHDRHAGFRADISEA